MNTLAYIVYLWFTFTITVLVGRRFYKNGRLFILNLAKEEALTDSINKLLLVGYYLLNLGYAALILKGWEQIETKAQLTEVIISKTGRIILILAVIHYFNMIAIYFGVRKQLSIHHK